MLVFSKRKELVELYEKWIKKNGIKNCAHSVIAFLCCHDLLNPENALSFIAKMKGGEG